MKSKVLPKALVTGATGVIGPELVKRLIEEGYSVRALCRSHHEPRGIPANVETIRGDITDDKILREAVKNVNIIFHLAAKLHEVKPSPNLRADYRRINIEGTRQLATAAMSAGVGRMIFFSTINVYDSCYQKDIHDENSTVKPSTIYAETKAEAENIVLSEMPSVVLRLAAVYGPSMKGNYRRLLAALRNRSFIMVGTGQNRRTLVHIQDVCQAAILTAAHASALGQVYNVTDGEIHTFQKIVRAICSALERGYPRFRISELQARRIFGFVEDAFELFGQKAPVGRFTVDKLLEDLAVRGDRITKELGYQPQFDLEAGWKNCVQRISI